MKLRLLVAWHRHQLRHWAWWVECGVFYNRPHQVGHGLARYDREDRILGDLYLGLPVR